MMLPSLVPTPWRYRQAVGRDRRDAPRSADRAVGRGGTSSCGPCSEWPPCRWASRRQRSRCSLPPLARAVPIAVGVVVLIAGALQFTVWKALAAAGRYRGAAGRRCRHGRATRPATRPPLQLLRCRPNGDPPRHRRRGARDGVGFETSRGLRGSSQSAAFTGRRTELLANQP
jgi:hypothetical protein